MIPPQTTRNYEFFFPIEVPALGYNTYFMCYSPEYDIFDTNANSASIENNLLQINFTKSISNEYKMHSIFNKISNSTHQISQEYLYYISENDDSFVFKSTETVNISTDSIVNSRIITGPYVQQMDQVLNNNTTQTIRIYNYSTDSVNNYYFDIIHDVQIPVNRELVSRFDTEIKNKGLFYTDNSLEIVERNYTSRFGATNRTNMIAGNFYPMIRTAYIKDNVSQFTILTTQSMAVSSQNNGSIEPSNGSIETLLHRRQNLADRRGMGEPMNDNSRVIIRQRVIAGMDPQTSQKIRTQLGYRLHNPMQGYFGSSSNIEDWKKNHTMTFSALNSELPKNIHLMTLAARGPFPQGKIVVRLNHIYEANQDPELSKPVIVNLASIFKYNFGFNRTSLSLLQNNDVESQVTLQPLQFKTYIIEEIPSKVTPSINWLIIGMYWCWSTSNCCCNILYTKM